MSEKLRNTVKKLINEFGYYEAKRMLGISFTKLAEIVDEPIHSELANEILIENIVKKTIQTKYKEFNISKSFDNVVYWEARIKTGRFLPNISEHIEVVATPFWDGNESTPVELDWYGLIDDNSNTNMDIVSINGGDLTTSTYVRIDDKKIFKNTHSLFKWYEEFYLPTIYEIIRTNYIPNAQQQVEDMLDKKFGPTSLREQIKKVLREDTKDKLLSSIKKIGLFDFLNLSKMDPFKLKKYIKYEEFPKEVIYKFLNDVGRSNKISEWISDYFNSPLHFTKDGKVHNIQTFGQNGEVSGEIYSDYNVTNFFLLKYHSLPDDTLEKLYDLTLVGPFYNSIYLPTQVL